MTLRESKQNATDCAAVFFDKNHVNFPSASALLFSFGTIKVGSADQDDSQGNPVLAYLQRHGTAQGLTTPLVTGYYSWLRLRP